jgi:hypothetical protein
MGEDCSQVGGGKRKKIIQTHQMLLYCHCEPRFIGTKQSLSGRIAELAPSSLASLGTAPLFAMTLYLMRSC